MERVKALFFDVFGTLVDWRGSMLREIRAVLSPLGVDIDWPAFADAWHRRYQPAMDEVRSGRLPFTKLDVLQRRNLDLILPEFGLGDLDEPTRINLNAVWHRFDAWPDAVPALARLRLEYRLAPCSNGNVSIMVELARRNGFVWDAIVGAEFARDYKPKASVYLSAAAAFGCKPEQAMMIAAHSYDLAAAAAAGLRTAFIARPDEYGPGTGELAPSVPVDVSAESMTALADRLLGV